MLINFCNHFGYNLVTVLAKNGRPRCFDRQDFQVVDLRTEHKIWLL